MRTLPFLTLTAMSVLLGGCFPPDAPTSTSASATSAGAEPAPRKRPMTEDERFAAVVVAPTGVTRSRASGDKDQRAIEVAFDVVNGSDVAIAGVQLLVGVMENRGLDVLTRHAEDHWFDEPLGPGEAASRTLRVPGNVGRPVSGLEARIVTLGILTPRANADAWKPLDREAMDYTVVSTTTVPRAPGQEGGSASGAVKAL